MKCKLSDFINFKNGKKKPIEYGDIPIYGGNGILGYTNKSNNDSCVVIGRVGAYCGSVYYEANKCWISDNAIAANEKNNADIKFIYYLLKTLNLNQRHIGTSQPLLTQEILNNIECFLPDLETQKKIAKVLSALDDKIEQNNAINHNLQQQAQAIFRSWFIENEESISWPYGVFADLLTGIVGGDWGKDSPAGNNTEMVYCIRGADIPEVCAGNKGKMPIRYILLKNYLAKRLVEGDIVVEISGGSPTQSTGRVAVISKALLDRYDKGMVCTNFCRALKPLAGYSMYIYHYWQYLYDKGVFFSYENGTTGIKNLDINGFAETEPIIIAPIKEIKKFDELCQNIYSKIYANGLENEKLAILRDTLLPKLMSGELDVSEVEI